MNPDSYKNYVLSILRQLNVALILGALLGLVLAALHIYKNQYLNYKVYNIVLLDLKTYITDYMLIFIAIALGLIALYGLIGRVFQIGRLKRFQEKNSAKKIPEALYYSVILVIVFGVICYSLYPDIISFLKSSFLAGPLHEITKSWEETYKIFSIVSVLTGLILIILGTYILSRFNLVHAAERWFHKLTGSRTALALGSSLLAIVLLLNIFAHFYKSLNSPEGPNIIVISIDTLRADHLGSYGHQKDTSPNIDKFADKAVLFENAYSQGSWTYPSMTSMHTSLYPSQAGITYIEDKIHDSYMTLAEYMKNNFYYTYAVISNPVVSEPLGFSQGFDIFDQDSIRKKNELTAHLVTERATEYLDKTLGEKFFLWLHYMDPHSNYIHHPEFGYAADYKGTLGQNIRFQNLNHEKHKLDHKDLEYIKDLYAEEISYTDKHIGRLLDYLSKLGLFDNTIVIITADHGEEFMERNRFGHGHTAHQELIHVPLIIYVPSDKELGAKRVESTAEVRSIARTVLDLCGIRGNQIQGQNLLITAEDDDSTGYAFSQNLRDRGHYRPSEAIMAGNWKLINNLTLNTYELYNLENDPEEKTNLFESSENGLDGMKKDLISKLSGINKERVRTEEVEEVEFNEEDIKRLKALGYME